MLRRRINQSDPENPLKNLFFRLKKTKTFVGIDVFAKETRNLKRDVLKRHVNLKETYKRDM